MLNLALTGNIASGKSSVSRQLARHGATIIDSDVLSRMAVAPGTRGLAAVIARFGDRVRGSDGSLDRAALREIVFHDPDAREALNALVHPEVRRLRNEELVRAGARGDRVVISDIPLLFEIGLEKSFDGVILVDAPEHEREARLVRDRALSHEEARAMIAAQMPSSEKRAGARWIVENDGSREQLEARVEALWQELSSLAPLPQSGPAADTSA